MLAAALGCTGSAMDDRSTSPGSGASEAPDRVEILTVHTFIERAPDGPESREIFEEQMVSSRVLQSGDLSSVWAGYEARFGDPGDIMRWSGVDAISLIRFNDEWRISSIAFGASD